MRLRSFSTFLALILLMSVSLLVGAFPVSAVSLKHSIELLDKQARPSNRTPSITSQAQDNLPYPSWWNGTVCDTSKVSNSVPLGAYYRGVTACGPIGLPTDPAHEVIFPNGFGEYEWQCVEFSMRFMYLAYGISAYNAPTGTYVVDNYTNQQDNPDNYNNPILVQIQNTNPSTTDAIPQPGDILSYYSNHTAVVSKTNVINGNGTLTVIEQNFHANGMATINVGSNAGLPAYVLDTTKIKNWLHHTIDLTPQTAPPTAKVTINGDGFGPDETVTMTFDTTLLGTTTTSGTGTFSTTITIPASAQPGTHMLQFYGETSGFTPQTVFYVQTYVQTNWPMFGYNAQHTRYNPKESVLNTTNVPGLTLDWSYTAGSYIYSSSPAIANGIVYVGSWDHKLYALDANTGSFRWSYTTGNDIYSSPAVVNGMVYFGSLDQKIYSLDAMTGSLKWSYTTGNFIESSPTVANGLVYIGSDDNSLYALDAKTGILRWSYATSGIVNSSPTVANGLVYIGSGDNKLYALDAMTGAFKWSYNTGGGIYYSPVVVNGVVYFSSTDGNLYALKAKTGVRIWKYNNVDTFSSAPAVANGIIYVGSSADGKLYALDTLTGILKWTYLTGVISYSSPAVANGVVYIGSDTTEALYALDATSGAFLWQYYTGGSILSSPAVVNGVVYVGSDDYKLYAFYL